MDKPITVKIEELKQKLVADVNNSGLHLYIVDSVFKELYNEIHVTLANLTKQEVEDYNKAISEENEKVSENAIEK